MDMKRIRRQLSPARQTDPENNGVFRVADRKLGLNMFRTKGVFVMCLIAVSLLITLVFVYRDPPNGFYQVSDRVHGSDKEELRFNEKGTFGVGGEGSFESGTELNGVAGGRDLEGTSEKGSKDGFSRNAVDKFIGGLLAAGFEEGACLSRYQSALYRKISQHRPSAYLLGRLRKYESLHKRCGPSTKSYYKALDQLKLGLNPGTIDCKYVVWISNSGLGNRILTIASVFLYTLLTNRVLLVDQGSAINDLFCEPFPENSWLLPLDFPLIQFNSLNNTSPHRYGHMLKNNIINDNRSGSSSGALLPAFVYLHLSHDYDHHDKLFFCDQEQLLLQKIPFLFLRSDNYFVPSLFLIPTFKKELSNMFPEKDSVFHHLGRYLFHPSNCVWGLITRFYDAYLANAEESIGIQIRTFDTETGPFPHVMDQILACTKSEKLLPEISLQELVPPPTKKRSKAVLVTSLSAGYFEKIRNMYWEHPTVSGEIVSVYQPSHEGYQQMEKQLHTMKAWAEMYLLSLCDVLVTSSWSTFGYVAQGLGGIRPWILFKPENRTAPNPPCRRALSMEPCFHAPPFYDCKTKTGTDTGNVVPHVKHCEDMSWGLKLVSHDQL